MTPEQFAAAALRLGLNGSEFERIRAMPFEEGVKALDELKLFVKKRYREAALELHPDRTGGDPVKTEEFKRITATFERIERLRLVRRPQNVPFVGYMNTGSAVPTTTVGHYGDGARVRVRVTVTRS